jgi:hypothetical protein
MDQREQYNLYDSVIYSFFFFFFFFFLFDDVSNIFFFFLFLFYDVSNIVTSDDTVQLNT